MATLSSKSASLGLCRPANVLITSLVIWSLLVHAAWAAPPVKRARPPKFSKSIADTFYPNANSKLVGARPVDSPVDFGSPEDKPAANLAITGATKKSQGWSKLIAADSIEDEIKSQQIQLSAAVASPNKFKGGDYQRARLHLNVLAALFAIDAQYDGKLRWQREAAGMRDLLARAGANCKVGTDGSYNEARLRSEDLQNLIRGGTLSLPEATSEIEWNRVADRASLMKRLEHALDDTVTPVTGSSVQFSRQADKLSHEAQLIAAIAEVIQREGYEFADDETYRELAQQMGAQAVAMRDAVADKNYERARAAAGQIGKACSNCHEGYRN